MKDTIINIVIVLVLILVGFILGRCTVEEETTTATKYMKLPEVHDTIVKPCPYIVKAPVDTFNIIQECVRDGVYIELFPTKIDTIYTSADTLKIVIDWATERKYAEVLFDCDTLGKLTVDASVQYNRLRDIGYNFTPVQKQTETTTTRKRTFEPFLGVGVLAGLKNSEPELQNVGPGVELGAFIKEHHGIALEYQYLINTKRSGNNVDTHEIGVKYIYKL